MRGMGRLISMFLQGLIGISVLSCHKLPSPAFSVDPAWNPEAGDTLVFLNESRHARTYLWEFGDGKFSSRESPVHIFEEAGIFQIKLTASSGSGSDFISRPLTVNEPTVLGFITYDSTRQQILEGTGVWVFDNETDRDRWENACYFGQTGGDGMVEFRNLEAEVYYVRTYKPADSGAWVYRGSTSRLKLNTVNLFLVPGQWSGEVIH